MTPFFCFNQVSTWTLVIDIMWNGVGIVGCKMYLLCSPSVLCVTLVCVCVCVCRTGAGCKKDLEALVDQVLGGLQEEVSPWGLVLLLLVSRMPGEGGGLSEEGEGY